MVGTTKALELAELSEFSNSLTHRFCSPGQLTFWVMIQNLGKVYQCHAHMESYSETGRQKTSTVLFLPPCSNAHVQWVTDAGKKMPQILLNMQPFAYCSSVWSLRKAMKDGQAETNFLP